MHQHRLMSRCMPTCLDHHQTGQEFGVSINEPVAQGWMIPVNTGGSIAWMSAACQFIVLALDDEFGLRKGIVIACMVHVEMGTNDEIDLIRTQTKIREMLKHIFFIVGRGHSRRSLIICW